MRRTRGRGATTSGPFTTVGASLTGEAKGPEGLLLAVTHPAAVFDFFVVIAEHVQDSVGHEVADLPIDRVPEVLRLGDGRGERDHHVAQTGRLVGRQDQTHATGDVQWK